MTFLRNPSSCVCTYVCVCIYIYTYKLVCVCFIVYGHINIHYIHVFCIPRNLLAFTRTRIQYTSSLGSSDRLRAVAYQNLFTKTQEISLHDPILEYVHIHVCAYICVCIYNIGVYIYVYIYIYIYIYTYIRKHTQIYMRILSIHLMYACSCKRNLCCASAANMYIYIYMFEYMKLCMYVRVHDQSYNRDFSSCRTYIHTSPHIVIHIC